MKSTKQPRRTSEHRRTETSSRSARTAHSPTGVNDRTTGRAARTVRPTNRSAPTTNRSATPAHRAATPEQRSARPAHRPAATTRRSAPETHRSEPVVNRPPKTAPRAPQQPAGPGYWVMGRNAVAELIRVAPERVRELWCSDESSTIASSLPRNVTIHRDGDRNRLAALVGSESHQGIIAWAAPRPSVTLGELLAAIPADAPSLLILPDGINDPQNLGAIIRAAECFGADGVILNRNRGCGITPVVTKSSVGASEIVPLIEVSNADQALRQCQQHQFWVVAAARTPDAASLRSFTFPTRTLLIVGSEGDGVQPLLLKRADHHLAIEQVGAIDSLNVSQATAILSHEYRRQQPQLGK